MNNCKKKQKHNYLGTKKFKPEVVDFNLNVTYI